MALHGGNVFTRGDYSEVLTCESCHMPYATSSGSTASAAVVGALGRAGDTRTHIFRISTDPIDNTSFLSPDGTRVMKDANGRATLTVDYVCLRCHNEGAMPSLAFTVERAAEIAIGLHCPAQSESLPRGMKTGRPPRMPGSGFRHPLRRTHGGRH
jgi:hypothetical protein